MCFYEPTTNAKCTIKLGKLVANRVDQALLADESLLWARNKEVEGLPKVVQELNPCLDARRCSQDVAHALRKIHLR